MNFLIWLSLIIPLGFAIWSFIYYKDKLAFWEPFIPFAITILIVFLFKWIGINSATSDTEYLSDHIATVFHDDEWDEWVTQTCTRSVPCGSDSKGNTTYCTETYDCSHSVTHPEKWFFESSNGETTTISSSMYHRLVKKFGTGERFVDMNRDYYTKDGDRHTCSWDGNPEKVESYHWTHSYENRIQASNNIFNYPKVSLSDFKKNKLFDYPKILNDNKCNSIICDSGINISLGEYKQFDNMNCILGPKKQIHVWVVLYLNSNIDRAFMQESYWKGGNKNELNICIGVDDQNKVKWCHIISWTESQKMKIRTKNFVEDMDKLDMNAVADYLITNIPKHWKRKNFSDFDYLKIDTPLWAIITTYILVFIASIGINIWSITNEFDNIDEGESNWINKIKERINLFIFYIRNNKLFFKQDQTNKQS